tara:strand:+ start:668 stop:1216 length:549 start_codon:yes stop_codon:yes gene_type:complete
MTSRNPVAYDIAEITRDQGFTGATVHIHPANWTSRRRNIILRALRDGMSTAGYETSHFIEKLTRSYGSTVVNASHTDMLQLDAVRDDKQEAMLAYTAAWVKISLSQVGEVKRWDYRNYLLQNWLERVEAGDTMTSFPLPKIPPQDRVSFIKEYLKDDEDSIRTQLADKIEAGEELTIFVEAA